MTSVCCFVIAILCGMARIVSFTPITKDRLSRHSDVECGFSFVTYDDNSAVLLETYGSKDRVIPGKTSQSLLIDRDAAARLIAILERIGPASRTRA
jgi:hypothetical protein